MPKYLIAFNVEWVPAHTADELRRKSEASQALLDDMKAAGIQPGGSVRIRSEYAELIFTCIEGKVPPGMIFVPYGPPTCHLMGRFTDGTGMPTSKGWEVEIEAVA